MHLKLLQRSGSNEIADIFRTISYAKGRTDSPSCLHAELECHSNIATAIYQDNFVEANLPCFQPKTECPTIRTASGR